MVDNIFSNDRKNVYLLHTKHASDLSSYSLQKKKIFIAHRRCICLIMMFARNCINSRNIRSLGSSYVYAPGNTYCQQQRPFSKYVNDSKTVKTYDEIRQPIALDIIRSGLNMSVRRQGLAMDKMKVLDAGCGTGNYIQALSGDVGSIVGLDSNMNILKQAHGKMKDNQNNVFLIQGNILDIPFQDNAFDAVILNQVNRLKLRLSLCYSDKYI